MKPYICIINLAEYLPEELMYTENEVKLAWSELIFYKVLQLPVVLSNRTKALEQELMPLVNQFRFKSFKPFLDFIHANGDIELHVSNYNLFIKL